MWTNSPSLTLTCLPHFFNPDCLRHSILFRQTHKEGTNFLPIYRNLRFILENPTLRITSPLKYRSGKLKLPTAEKNLYCLWLLPYSVWSLSPGTPLMAPYLSRSFPKTWIASSAFFGSATPSIQVQQDGRMALLFSERASSLFALVLQLLAFLCLSPARLCIELCCCIGFRWTFLKYERGWTPKTRG